MAPSSKAGSEPSASVANELKWVEWVTKECKLMLRKLW